MLIFRANPIKYGLLLSALTIVCLTLMELTGQNQSFDHGSPIFLMYQLFAPALVMYLGLQAKKKAQKGKLTFKQGVIESFRISLVFGVTSPFVFAAYYLFVNPAVIEYVRTAFQLTGMSDSVVIKIDMMVQFISAIIFGTLYGAIISLFVKSKS